MFSQTGLGPGIYDLAMTSCEVGPITIPGLWLPQVIRFSMDPWTPIQGLCGFKASHTFLWPPWRLQVPPTPAGFRVPTSCPHPWPRSFGPFLSGKAKDRASSVLVELRVPFFVFGYVVRVFLRVMVELGTAVSCWQFSVFLAGILVGLLVPPCKPQSKEFLSTSVSKEIQKTWKTIGFVTICESNKQMEVERKSKEFSLQETTKIPQQSPQKPARDRRRPQVLARISQKPARADPRRIPQEPAGARNTVYHPSGNASAYPSMPPAWPPWASTARKSLHRSPYLSCASLPPPLLHALQPSSRSLRSSHSPPTPLP